MHGSDSPGRPASVNFECKRFFQNKKKGKCRKYGNMDPAASKGKEGQKEFPCPYGVQARALPSIMYTVIARHVQ